MAVLTCTPGQVASFVTARQSLTRWRPLSGPDTATQTVERIGPIAADDPAAPFLSLAARLEAFEPGHLLATWQEDGRVVKRPVLGGRPHLIPRRRAPALAAADPARDEFLAAAVATGFDEEERRKLTEAVKNALRTQGSVALRDLAASLPSDVAVRLGDEGDAGDALDALVAWWWHRGDVERGVQVTDWRRDPLRVGAPPDEPVSTPDDDVARSEVARWYLHAFGPATPQDLAAWAGWPLRPTRAALAALERDVLTVAVSGWHGEDALLLSEDADALDGASDDPPPSAALLPVDDPLLRAYRTTRHRLGGHAGATRRVLGRGRPHAPVLVLGRVAGTWAWDPRDPERLTVHLDDQTHEELVRERAEELAVIVGADEVVHEAGEEE